MALATHTGFSKPFFIVTWVEFGVSIGLIISRCYTATRIIHHVAGDLYLTLATFILAIGSMSMITAGAAHGLGMSQIYLTLEQQHYALLYGWLSQFLALIAIGMGKLAIVAFLEQIQGGISRYRTFTLWFLAGSNLIVNVIAAVLAMVECNPVQKLWDEDIPGDCRGRKRIQIFGYVQGSWSAICDFALVLFPILVFARVRAFSMPTKIGICALMSCGIVAGACTIVKTVQLVHLTNVGDPTNSLANVIVWNDTEMWAVFIVSCIPPTKVFFGKVFAFVLNKCSTGVGMILSEERSVDED